jgi:hypothetical protein
MFYFAFQTDLSMFSLSKCRFLCRYPESDDLPLFELSSALFFLEIKFSDFQAFSFQKLSAFHRIWLTNFLRQTFDWIFIQPSSSRTQEVLTRFQVYLSDFTLISI